jgi:hypothetical protein
MALRRERTQRMLSRIRARAKAEGVDALSMDEINAEIAEARREHAPI